VSFQNLSFYNIFIKEINKERKEKHKLTHDFQVLKLKEKTRFRIKIFLNIYKDFYLFIYLFLQVVTIV